MDPVPGDSEPMCFTDSLAAGKHSTPMRLLATAAQQSESSAAELARLSIENDTLKRRVSELEQHLKAMEDDKLTQRVSELERLLKAAALQTDPMQPQREAERLKRERRVAQLTRDMPEESVAAVLEDNMVKTASKPPHAEAIPKLPSSSKPLHAEAIPKLPSPAGQPTPAPAPPPAEMPAPTSPAATPPPPPPLAQARDLSPFVGKWAIVREEGKAAYLNSLGMSFVVTKAAKSMATPPVRFTLDAQRTTLTSTQGPIFGKMISSTHPPTVTTTEEKSSQLGTQRIVSQWEDGEDGVAVLYCRTTTVGKTDVCDQRSRVIVDAGRPRLVVETRLTKTPGAPVVVYTRTYEPLSK